MVCLTTFGDTKWVISQSLIIFHTFYGYVQGRGVLSRGSAYLPPHSLHTSLPPHGSESSPFTQPGSLPNSSCSVVYFLWSDADFLISPAQPPASDCTEDNPGLPQCGAAKGLFSFSVRFRNHFMSNMEREKTEDETKEYELRRHQLWQTDSRLVPAVHRQPIPYLNTVFVTFIQML